MTRSLVWKISHIACKSIRFNIQLQYNCENFHTSVKVLGLIRSSNRENHRCGNFHTQSVKKSCSIQSLNRGDHSCAPFHIRGMKVSDSVEVSSEKITAMDISTIWVWKYQDKFEASTEKITIVRIFTPWVWIHLTYLQLLLCYMTINHSCRNFHTMLICPISPIWTSSFDNLIFNILYASVLCTKPIYIWIKSKRG